MFNLFKKQMVLPPSGLMPSPTDKRDILSSEILPVVKRYPKEYPVPFDFTVSHQFTVPSCVGHSCAAIKQDRELRERIFKVFDGDWIYYRCKEIDGIPDTKGTFFRAGLKILQKEGAKPKDEPATEAIKYRIGGYALVDDASFEGIKKAIFVNGSLLAGFRGTNAGWQTAYVKPPKQGEEVWGHAIELVGYNENYIIFQNSWGENWGDKGFGYLSKDYLPFLMEAWCILIDYPTELLAEQEGWIAENWAQISLEEDSVLRTTAKLNFRTQPSTVATIIKTLNIGEKLIYQGEKKKVGNYVWLRVKN